MSATLAAAAVLSLLASPAAAIDLPRPGAVQVYDGEAEDVQRDRRWRRYRDRGGVDAGDVIAGVLVLGAVAAIADAVTQSRQREADGAYRPPVRERGITGSGIDRAVDICVDAVESRGDPVNAIEGANRTSEGWEVSGWLDRGGAFACRIGNDGQVSDVSVDGPGGSWGYGTAPAERVSEGDYDPDYYAPDHYDDDYYAQAREGL